MEINKAVKALQNCKAFENRLVNLTKLLDENKDYPIKLRMLGFPPLEIKTKEELQGRIKELEDLLRLTVVKEGM